jgi:hypothetical protein
MKQIAIRVEDDLLEYIERARGAVPREAWLRSLIEAHRSRGRNESPAHQHLPPTTMTKFEMDMARQAKLNKAKGM